MVLKNPEGEGPLNSFLFRHLNCWCHAEEGGDSRVEPDLFSGSYQHQNTLATVAVDGFAESSPGDGRYPKHLVWVDCFSFPSNSGRGAECGWPSLEEKGIAGAWLPCATMKWGPNATLCSQMSDRDSVEPLLKFNINCHWKAAVAFTD